MFIWAVMPAKVKTAKAEIYIMNYTNFFILLKLFIYKNYYKNVIVNWKIFIILNQNCKLYIIHS